MRAAKVIPLQNTQNQFELAFYEAPEAFLMIHQGAFTANHAFVNLTGYTTKELKSKNLQELSPTSQDRKNSKRSKAFSWDLCSESGTYEDVVVHCKNKKTCVVDLVVKTGEFTFLIFRDVTEKKKLESEVISRQSELVEANFKLENKNVELKTMQETLVQAGKMAALGELSAGMAHELNQPLTAIKGYSQEIQSLFTGNESQEMKMFFEEIVKNADKMAKIIKYLRTFTRKSTEGFEMTDVHNSLEEALHLLETQLQNRKIEIERQYSKKLPKVFANPVQLEQVFINLITNARDAIDQAGKFNGKITLKTQFQKDFVVIEVSDNGCGMSEKTRSKIFNPFFTTKEVGKGMGLGMSLSYGILNKIHASLTVKSREGEGARFVIKIPQDFRELS